MAWSEAQLAAITTYDKNLLVAAAAGSGKTSVLVERIIRRLLDEKQNFHIDQVLVVTFTNAAAAEMRERIGTAIGQALKECPQSRHLERQLVLLNAASISTIHAFCQNIVRQNFHLLDLDPKFRLANDQETSLLKRDVLEALFEEMYAMGDDGFLRFVDHYGNESSDEGLYEIILELYQFSRSQPCPEGWLRHLPDPFGIEAQTAIDETIWAKMIKEEMALIFSECLGTVTELSKTAELIGFDFYVPIFESDREIFAELSALLEKDWEAVRKAAYAVKFATLKAPKDTDEQQKEFFSKKRNKVKDKLKWIKETYFSVSGAELLADLTEVQPMAEVICRLTNDFSAAFAKAKRTKAIVDFHDLEHFCLQILSDENAKPGCMAPSAVARALQEKYAEVMIDEYQDTNGVQEAILALVKKSEQPNLFLVGDVKQSVYRFRLAEPELFLEKYRTYPVRGDQFLRIDLAQNFRSRASVLAAINFLFAQVMSPKVAELSYGEAERLNPGPDYPPAVEKTVEGPVELHLIDRDDIAAETMATEGGESDEKEKEDLKGFALEAQFIAGRIQELMAEGTVVFDKGLKKYRPLAWRDIVILLRSVKHKANVLLETLHNANIPAYANVDSGYFQEIEVEVMLALLRVIDNPRQDIPLASVLHSPIAGLTASELARVRLIDPQGDLFSAVLQSIGVQVDLSGEVKDRLLQFLTQLSGWRSLARRKSVPELIWQLYRDTGYYDYVGGMPGGMLRQANLRLLYDRSRQYETTNFRGLFRFLRFIEKMRDTGTDLAVARTLGESENVVRVMSIHKSKGLEFPVVIASDLGKNFNLQDSTATLLLHKKLGLGPYVTNADLKLRYPTIARLAIASQMNRESKAEELRVLYVALTRAREKLILVGSARKLAAKAKEWCQSADLSTPLLPDYIIAGARSYLDWICPAVARHDDGQVLRCYGDCVQMRINAFPEDTSRWQVKITPASRVVPESALTEAESGLLDRVKNGEVLEASPKKNWVQHVLGWTYPDQMDKDVPAKLSVTEMKRRFAFLDESAESLFKPPTIVSRPRFIQEKAPLTGAEYGTIMHSVMQHVDYQGDSSQAGLKEQVQSLVRCEILLPEHAAIVDLRGVAGYLKSDIGKRMAMSPKVRRELPFSIMLNARRFYPELADDEEHIFVQGIIDVLFDEADGMVLVDYKTDKSTSTSEIVDKYQLQLNLYAEAVEKILGKKVKEKYLYLFQCGKMIEIV